MAEGEERAVDAGRLQLTGSDTGMKNINLAGPSEARIAALRSKVEKLKGMNAAMAEGEALLGAKKASKPAAEVAAQVNVTSNSAAAAPAAVAQTTSSVGGAWSPPAEVETYTPSGSGTWGVFERPVDVSRSMGGGRRIGLGAPEESAEEAAAKAAVTAALLQKFLANNAADETFERDNREAIEDALAEAKASMRMGEVRRAARTLEPFWRNLTVKTELGAQVGLELGMAYDAAYETEKAGEMYDLLLGSRDWNIRRLAKQLKFGHEAMQVLGVGAQADFADITAFSAMPELNVDKRYEQGYAGAMASIPMKTTSDALTVLRVAASDLAVQRWSAERVLAACNILAKPENRRVKECAPMTGVWRLVVQVGADGSVRADERLRQTIGFSTRADELRVSRTQSPGPFLISELEGSMRTVGEAGATAYDLRFDSCRVGPLRLPPGGPIRSTVLALDSTLLVTMERDASASPGSAARFFVWVQ
jgi:hypothetical protein